MVFNQKYPVWLLVATVVATCFLKECFALPDEVLTRKCEGQYICYCGANCSNPGYAHRFCLDSTQTCDGTPDCPLGDDESDALCHRGGFEATRTREVYLQVEEIEWDYFPAGMNLVDAEMDYINENMIPGTDRVGSIFSKFVYKRYTDITYTTEVPKPAYQGYVGPLIHAEVGERVRVFLKNTVNVSVSAHPHGFQYNKMSEGALYADGTTGPDTRDIVLPGDMVPLDWDLTINFAPTADDEKCMPWTYHSHVSTLKEVNAGLSGLLVVCKPGILRPDGTRTDVDKEFMLYLDHTNEGHSWLTPQNLQRCGNPAACQLLFDTEDEAFMASLKKAAINGYTFGNLPDLNFCVGDKVVWYLFSVEAEVHSVTFHGHTVLSNQHRAAVIGIWPATFRAVNMVSSKPGRWMISCLNTQLNTHGMRAFMNVTQCAGHPAMTDDLSGNVREYFLAAENTVPVNVSWDYAPSGNNLFDGGSLTASGSESFTYFESSATRIGGVYRKTRFVEYDSGFTTPATRSAAEAHLALLGPVLRAEVGDTIRITLKNSVDFPLSIYLQGVLMNKDQDGTWEKNPSGPSYPMEGRVVGVGDQEVYTFEVPVSVAPTDDDPPCLTYMYYSGYDFDRDVNTGLFGPLLICKRGEIDPATGIQRGIDRELFLFYSSVDENLSRHINYNTALYAPSANMSDPDFIESNMMHSINGRSYGNLEGLDICKHDRVMWHVMSFGQGEGLHGVTWNGNNLLIGGINRESHVTISGLSFTAAMMNADNVGTWSISCHTNQHFQGGMKALYTVDPCGDTSATYIPSNGVTRTYYVAAVERQWNYANSTIHPVTLLDYSDPNSDQYLRVRSDPPFVGSVYTKALYREYDPTFTDEQPHPAHLGVMGPYIRGEWGDTIKVVFKNMATTLTRPYSIHPMGLGYSKDEEGMPYIDSAGTAAGDGVAPGATYTYTWTVPKPADSGPGCVGSMYHSAVDPVKDVYSGLVGPLVICKRHTLDPNGARTDSIDEEFAMLFLAFDENQSWYFDVNVNLTALAVTGVTSAFTESNMYDSINGYIHANLPGLVMNQFDNVEWYVLGLGTTEDVHTVHFHGQMFIYRTNRAHLGDVIEVFPGTSESVVMYADNPGTWLLHCHVGAHLNDGMVAVYVVIPY